MIDLRLRTQAIAAYESGEGGYKVIAKRFGVSDTTIRRWVNPEAWAEDRIRSRLYKRRQKGICVDCGAETSYNGHHPKSHPSFVSLRCSRCGAKQAAAFSRSRRGTGPRAQELLALLAEGPTYYQVVVDRLDITKDHASVLLNRMIKYGLIERPRRGVYQLPQED